MIALNPRRRVFAYRPAEVDILGDPRDVMVTWPSWRAMRDELAGRHVPLHKRGRVAEPLCDADGDPVESDGMASFYPGAVADIGNMASYQYHGWTIVETGARSRKAGRSVWVVDETVTVARVDRRRDGEVIARREISANVSYGDSGNRHTDSKYDATTVVVWDRDCDEPLFTMERENPLGYCVTACPDTGCEHKWRINSDTYGHVPVDIDGRYTDFDDVLDAVNSGDKFYLAQ